MKKEMTMPEITETKPPEREILYQWGTTDEDTKLFKVERPFFLQIVDGPLRRIEAAPRESGHRSLRRRGSP